MPGRMMLRSEKGSVILTGLIMVAVVSFIASAIFQWQLQQNNVRLRTQTVQTANAIREKVLRWLYDPTVWDATSAGSTCLATGTGCPAGAHGVLRVKANSSEVLFDSNDVGDGFNRSGNRCNGIDGSFNSAGNHSCPYRYQLTWAATNCTGSPVVCQIQISGVFAYSEIKSMWASAGNINASRFNISFIKGFETDSLKSTCTSSGGTLDEASGLCTGGDLRCPANQVLVKSQNDQNPTCVPSYATQTCPTNQMAVGVKADGTLDCQSVAPDGPACTYAYTQDLSACKCTGTACTKKTQRVWTYPSGATCNTADSVDSCTYAGGS